MYMFGQYGMDEISLDKFLYLLNKGTGDIQEFDEEENDIGAKAHNKIFEHDFWFRTLRQKNNLFQEASGRVISETTLFFQITKINVQLLESKPHHFLLQHIS